MRSLTHLMVAGAVLAVLGQLPQAFATSSTVVYDVEGNPGCKQILSNSVSELKTTSVVVGTSTQISLGSQTVTYTVNGTNLEKWTATQPVNAVVIKKSGNAGSIIYHFGAAGVTEDTDEPAGTGIAAIAFCWGLRGTVVQESAYEACPPGLEAALDTLDGKFVLFGIDRQNVQGKPFQCLIGGRDRRRTATMSSAKGMHVRSTNNWRRTRSMSTTAAPRAAIPQAARSSATRSLGRKRGTRRR